MSVRIEKLDRVTTVIIDRPQLRNAIDRATAEALAEAFLAFDADAESDVAVLWGAGGHFCAGADLKALAEGRRPNRVEEGGDGPLGPTRMRLTKPVIAAVSGYAVAGGLELALWCDLRVMEEDAVFGVFCRRWGVPLIDGGTIRLPRLIGLSRAMDLILTGRPLPASEALHIGLANRVVPKGDARAAAEALAAELVRFPQRCLRNDRLSAYEQYDLGMEEALLNETRRGLEVLNSGETLRGAARFAAGKGRGGSFEDL
ncbi:MAG TPA: crotonase/enoyl-CoA hydratase family protein [Nevskia sp.]|nr:crotonase/enoyl-CoA hydratase family protein [Nevskia sp.]